MKFRKSGLLVKALLVGAIVVALILVGNLKEGFQAATSTTAVDLYFTLGNNGVPAFVSSSNPNVHFVAGLPGGTAALSVSGLGNLKDYIGQGWSSANAWVPLPATKLDKSSNALRIQGMVNGNNKMLHKPNYAAAVLATSTTEAKLPQNATNLTVMGLDTATFGLGTNPGDSAHGGAKLWVQLTFGN